MTKSDPIFLEAAEKIGHQLCRDAIWAGERCNWLGWAMVPLKHSWTVAYRAQSSGIYDGTAGIALFLARLYEFTKDKLLKETLHGALNQALDGAEKMDDRSRPSFFNGLTGIAFTCIEAGEVLDNKRLVKRGLELLESLSGIKPDGAALDVCTGSAGAIHALVDMAVRYRRERLLETAQMHGQHLIRQAKKTGEGWSWETMPGFTKKNLLGYAHGTSGIAAALLELWLVTGREEFRQAAVGAFHYERTHYNEAHANWPDFRQADPTAAAPSQQTSPTFMLAWCHGAPGVGFSRLRAFQLLPYDPMLAQEIQTALQSTVNAFANASPGGYGNFSLCHGAGGNADLLLIAADVLARPEMRQAAETVGRNGIAQYHAAEMPWPCGVNVGAESPNLMLGLAGIGYFYLRLYDASTVPSILSLTTHIKPEAKGTNAASRAPAKRRA